MQSENMVPVNTVTPQFLSSLDKAQLVDLLQNKTHLLVTARILRIQDHDYLKALQKEVELIQAAVKAREA